MWNFRGEMVTRFEDHVLWHPDSNTSNIYITSKQDYILSYCRRFGFGFGFGFGLLLGLGVNINPGLHSLLLLQASPARQRGARSLLH